MPAERRPPPGVRIEKARREAGLTLEQLAERAGLAVSTIDRIEADHGGAYVSTALKLAKALGATVEELFG